MLTCVESLRHEVIVLCMISIPLYSRNDPSTTLLRAILWLLDSSQTNEELHGVRYVEYGQLFFSKRRLRAKKQRISFHASRYPVDIIAPDLFSQTLLLALRHSIGGRPSL